MHKLNFDRVTERVKSIRVSQEKKTGQDPKLVAWHRKLQHDEMLALLTATPTELPFPVFTEHWRTMTTITWWLRKGCHPVPLMQVTREHCPPLVPLLTRYLEAHPDRWVDPLHELDHCLGPEEDWHTGVHKAGDEYPRFTGAITTAMHTTWPQIAQRWATFHYEQRAWLLTLWLCQLDREALAACETGIEAVRPLVGERLLHQFLAWRNAPEEAREAWHTYLDEHGAFDEHALLARLDRADV